MTGTFRIEALTKAHARADFSCGVQALDHYFQTQVTQDIRRSVAFCFVAISNDSHAIAGFYTLSASSVPLLEIPEALKKKLPKYPVVPVALMGRLAVDESYQGQKLGAILIADAVKRASKSELATWALVVDAKNQNAEDFYRHFGFRDFGSEGQLVLPHPRKSP